MAALEELKPGVVLRRLVGRHEKGKTEPGYIGIIDHVRRDDEGRSTIFFTDGCFGNWWRNLPDQWQVIEVEPITYAKGDRVRFIDTNHAGWWFKPGDVGTIDDIVKRGAGKLDIWILFDNHGDLLRGVVSPDMIELIEGENAMPRFEAGQRVRRKAESGAFLNMKPGDIGIVKRLVGENSVEFEGIEGLYSARAYELAEPEVAAQGKPVKFVFASKGGKYYAKGSFTSLEAARQRTQTLRRRLETADVYEYMMVEDA